MVFVSLIWGTSEKERTCLLNLRSVCHSLPGCFCPRPGRSRQHRKDPATRSCFEFREQELRFNKIDEPPSSLRIFPDMCNDGVRRPSWEDIRKLSTPVEQEPDDYKADYDPEENIIDLESDFNQVLSGPKDPNYPPDGPLDPLGRPDFDVNDVDGAESDVDDSELMITSKINDNFGASSHGTGRGGGANFPHGSATGAGRNETERVAKPPFKRTRGGKAKDRPSIKGKDKTGKDFKNNFQSKSKGQKGSDSGARATAFSIMSLLPLLCSISTAIVSFQ